MTVSLIISTQLPYHAGMRAKSEASIFLKLALNTNQREPPLNPKRKESSPSLRGKIVEELQELNTSQLVEMFSRTQCTAWFVTGRNSRPSPSTQR